MFGARCLLVSFATLSCFSDNAQPCSCTDSDRADCFVCMFVRLFSCLSVCLCLLRPLKHGFVILERCMSPMTLWFRWSECFFDVSLLQYWLSDVPPFVKEHCYEWLEVGLRQKVFLFVDKFIYLLPLRASIAYMLKRRYTVSQKTCDYIFYNNFNNKCPITIIFGIVSSKSMTHRKLVLFSTSSI